MVIVYFLDYDYTFFKKIKGVDNDILLELYKWSETLECNRIQLERKIMYKDIDYFTLFFKEYKKELSADFLCLFETKWNARNTGGGVNVKQIIREISFTF